MRGAGIGSSQVVEGLGIVLAGLVERGAAGEEDGRSDDVHRGDGSDGIGRNLLVAGHAHQAAMEEVTDLLGDLGGVELNALLAIELDRKVDERRGVDRQTVAQDVDDADGGTTQRVRIGRASRGLADGKDAGNGIELVGAGHDAASGALGQLVAGKAGTIVIADGVGDLVVLPHCGGIITAHHALLARELDDGVGHQVGLAQVSGASSVGGKMGTQVSLAGNSERELLNTLGLGEHATELLLEGDLGQALTELVKGDLQILLVEELGVVQAGAHDALVAVDHALGILGLAVGNDHELTRQLALAVIDREVALVGEHRLADDLVRDLEELLIEGTDEHRRPLAEVDDLLKDLLGRIDVAARTGSLDLGDTGKDGLATALGGEHAGILEHLLVDVGAGDHMVTGAKHPMAARGVAARHVSKRHGHDVLAQKAANPADRTHERGVLVAPALRTVVGPLQAGDGLLAQGRQNRGGRGGRNVLLGKDVLTAVGVLATDQILGSHTALAGKALGGLGGVTVSVEGDVGRGATLDLVNLIGRGGDVGNERGQATRARDHADLAVGQTGLVETLGDHGAKLFDGIVQRCRGHFLRTDLKQEILSVCHGLRHLAFLIGILVDSGDLGHIGLAARLGDGANAQDVVGALDCGQRTAGIEQVEGMAALHDAVVRRQRQLALQAGVALGLVVVKLLTHHLDVGDLKVVGTKLALVLQEHVAIGHGRAVGQVAPHQIVDGVDALRIHGDALQAIGDLDGHGVDLDTAHLLEVRKLRNLHAVEPDLPAKTPGAERRALPVVLDKADVMVVGIQANGGKRPQVELLGVDRRGLDEHLELIIVLHAVGVLAVAAVGGTAAGLCIAGAPLGGTERAQRGRGMEGTGTDLGVIGLHNDAALLAPVLLEAQDDVLEGKR